MTHYIKKTRTKIPALPMRIDRSNPITRELRFVQVGGHTYEVVYGANGTLTGNAKAGQPSEDGMLALLLDGTGDSLDFNSHILPTATQEISIYSKHRSNDTGIWQCLFNRNSGASNNDPFFGYNTSNDLTTYLKGNFFSTSLVGSMTDLRSAGLSINKNGISEAKHYQNGKFVAQSASGTQTLSTAGVKCSVGSAFADGDYFNGNIYITLVWARCLSDAEHAIIDANPAQVFTPEKKILSLPAASGIVPHKIEKPITTQPSKSAKLNKAHPLSKHLMFAQFNGFDFISHEMASISSNVKLGGISKYGQTLKSTGLSSTGSEWPINDRLKELSTQSTIFVFANVTQMEQWSTLFCLPHNTSWANPYSPLLFYRDSTTSNLRYFTCDASASSFVNSDSGAIDTTSGPVVYAARRKDTTITFYRNGLQHGAQKTLASNRVPSTANLHNPIIMQAHPNSDTQNVEAECPITLLFDIDLSDAWVKSISANPWQLFKPKIINLYTGAAAGGGDQNILPSGIASAETFGSLTVSPGAVSVSPGGIASAETFGSIKINQQILVQAIASAEAFGAVTITAGGVNILPGGIASAEAFGSPVVTVGTLFIDPAGIASAEAFGSITFVPGAVTITPNGIASGEVFGTISINTGFVILPNGIASAEVFGDHVIVPGATVILPNGIASGESFGSLQIIGGDAGLMIIEAILSLNPAIDTTLETKPVIETIIEFN